MTSVHVGEPRAGHADLPLPSLPPLRLMTPSETALLDAAAAHASCVIEFGAGDSTLRLCALRAGSIFTVESDPAWAASVASHPLAAAAIAAARLRIREVDIGPTGDWGYPTDASRRAAWPGYWMAPWQALPASAPDLVIVDGRFRVACVLQALLAGVDGLTVFVHDFERTAYHAVLPHVAQVGTADRARIFVRAPGFDRAAAERDLAACAFDPR
ncbi:MAG: hypothetical protein ACKOWF_01435 [Chloroflexota bacterium]